MTKLILRIRVVDNWNATDMCKILNYGMNKCAQVMLLPMLHKIVYNLIVIHLPILSHYYGDRKYARVLA